MNEIHPTAIINENAKLGDNIVVGPYTLINDNVTIDDGCHIGPHVVIYEGARIGKQVNIYQGASISHVPQHMKYNNEPTLCYVGDNTNIHEFATIHRGTVDTGKTVVGKNVLMMAYSHVAHDCRIGDNCIIANAAQLGGFTELDEWVIIGGSVPVHQFCKIGKHVMIGTGTGVGKDVPPFILAADEPLKYAGLNVVGLRRRGFTTEQLDSLKKVYHILYDSQLNVTQAKEKITNDFPNDPLAKEVLDFINRSHRGLLGK
ncbi:MAG: acyl-ACP--UDP-N-acetylglucosamine O-acyltransferase [Ignavibacteriales bacterium]|nr:acyl-ACP--UDP-N-acetylglucosamine O-acyltransferase [Ignavibacteriales bacterium]